MSRTELALLIIYTILFFCVISLGFNRGHHAMIHVKHPPYHIGSGYDAEWWEESAIDRE